MLGFSPISATALGDDTGDVTSPSGELVLVPTANISISVLTPIILGEASINVPTADAEISALAPATVSGGASALTPSFDISVFSVSPEIFTGTSVSVPASGTSIAVFTPEILTGVTVSDIDRASYDSVSLDVSSQDSIPYGIAFNNDGTKMYMVGDANDSVFQYSLSSAFDLSSASYDSVSLDVSSQDPTPYDIAFNGDGTKMYMVGGTNKTIFQYTLSTAFDLSTASYDSVSFSVSSQNTVPRSIAFNNDGTKMYILGLPNNTVFQYSLSTGFDLSTASYDSVSFSVVSQDSIPTGIAFNNDGTKMYMVGRTNDSVFQYSLSSAFDLSSASYDSVSFSVASQDTSPRGIAFNNDGTKMYMVGAINDSVYQYTVPLIKILNIPAANSALVALAPQTQTSVSRVVPDADIAISTNAPAVSAGASVAVPAADTAVAAFAPEIITGVTLDVPAADTSVAALAPQLQTGVSRVVPAIDFNIAAFAPVLSTGTLLSVPASGTSIAVFTPEILTGVTVSAPAADISVNALAPEILTSVSVSVPPADISLAAIEPTVVSGPSVSVPITDIAVAANTPAVNTGVSIQSPAANINAAPLAPVINTGASVSVPVANINAAPLAPVINTGVSVAVPASDITLSVQAPDVSASASIVAVPASDITLSVQTPDVSASVSVIAVPSQNTSISALTPKASISSLVIVGSASVTIKGISPFVGIPSGRREQLPINSENGGTLGISANGGNIQRAA